MKVVGISTSAYTCADVKNTQPAAVIIPIQSPRRSVSLPNTILASTKSVTAMQLSDTAFSTPTSHGCTPATAYTAASRNE